ncbi:hypothetical protein DPMN_034327 [Dreissena polymorpha]|uniref:Transmembrane protein n=1 Tax=Dreissena polymorpha TaxID=45954 RepID=A0A9D4M6M6_DREPO|nr:hypothetical protein DPMN_034327 [Dreissena polymorpha]
MENITGLTESHPFHPGKAVFSVEEVHSERERDLRLTSSQRVCPRLSCFQLLLLDSDDRFLFIFVLVISIVLIFFQMLDN